MKEKKRYFIGLGGIGMSALAHICLDQGEHVLGSDLNDSEVINALKKRGVKVSLEQLGELLTDDFEVVYSSAIKAEHAELKKAKDLKCSLLHRSELLKQVMQNKKAAVITGTHGKTTTTALMAHVLKVCEYEPSYMIGGTVPSLPCHGAYGKGEWFIIEGDESDGSLVNYEPALGIITNIEKDHVDHYSSEKQIVEIFKCFIDKIPQDFRVWCYDDPTLRSLKVGGVSYGRDINADWYYANYKQEANKSFFDLCYKKKKIGKVTLSLMGEHNALNTLAVIAACSLINVPLEKTIKALETFKGVGRRCEHKGDICHISVLDDYAHHPTEVTALLKSLRKRAGERRLVAVFEPHRTSRFNAFYQDFLKSFSEADTVFVTDIYSLGETIEPKISMKDFAKELKGKGIYLPRKGFAEALWERLSPHDFVVTIGAGSITKVSAELVELLKTKGLKKRTKLAVIYGGPSPEHYVAIESFKTLYPHFDRELYDVDAFYVTPEGKWVRNEEAPSVINASIIEALQASDLCVPIMHGFWGEDGALQGFLETLGLTYAASQYREITLTMDKIATKAYLSSWSIPCVPFFPISELEWKKNSKEILLAIEQKMTYPLYVKPNHLGSSLGISRVENREALQNAIEEALHFDTHALIEEEVIGRQMEFSLLGTEEVFCFDPGEIICEGAFVEYKGKYGSKALPMDTPANIPEKLREEGKILAKKAYCAMNLSGSARIDFFLTEKGEFLLNEINPIPGFTPTSMYPLILNAAAFPFKDYLDQLVISALYQKRRMKRKKTDMGHEGIIS